MPYSAKLPQFLIDRGDAFKLITHLDGPEQMPGEHSRLETSKVCSLTTCVFFRTRIPHIYISSSHIADERLQLLYAVMMARESQAEIGTDESGGPEH